MKRRQRRQFIDVSRAQGRLVARRYEDATVRERIQALKVDRDGQLGRLAAKHAQEVRDLDRRQRTERRLVWDAFDRAKNKLLARRSELVA